MTPSNMQQALSFMGSKTLLMGGVGTGKTHSIRTWLDAGITPFIIYTEPSDVLGDLPEDKCHWKYIPPAAPDWSDMLQSAQKINTLSFKVLSELEEINRSKYRQWMEVLNTLANFTCDRTGKSYGPVDNWSTDRVVVCDSLSGLSIMSMDLVRGSKPTAAPGQWGMAMDNLERLIQKLCVATPSHFVMTAHIEKEYDEISGGSKTMASTLGKKLAPKIPRFFSNVISCERDDKGFYWSTDSFSMELKARHLPRATRLPPTFTQIVNGWKALGGTITPTKEVNM